MIGWNLQEKEREAVMGAHSTLTFKLVSLRIENVMDYLKLV